MRTRDEVAVTVFAVDPDAVLLFVRLVTSVDDVVTEAVVVLLALGLADSVTDTTPVDEVRGDPLTDVVCEAVLEAREE